VALPVEPVLLPQPTELAEAVVAAMPEPDFPEPAEPVTLAVVPEPPIELVPAEPVAVELPPIELPSVALPPDLNAVVEFPVDAESPDLPEPLADSWPQAEPVLEAEPWLAEPELPLAPVDAPVTLHPPVPAAELPPLDAPEKKTPFWKKELSVSRKPKAEKTPKAEKAPKEKGAPFWKKELSFSRKPKAAAVEAPT